MTDERRRAERFAIWFPMQIDGEGDSIIGISRDISAVGVMMVAAAHPEPDAEVTVVMTLPQDEQGKREVKGRIVRVEPNPDDPEGLWRHRVAVEFADEIPELEPLLQEVSRASQPPAPPSQPPPPRSSFPPPKSGD